MVFSLAIMARLVVFVLGLLTASGLADKVDQKPADHAFLQKQLDLMLLYQQIHEPLHVEQQRNIAKTWDIEKNFDKFNDVEIVKLYWSMVKNAKILPRGVPFAVLEQEQVFEASTLFKVLFSAKDYETFYKTAVYLRDQVNEELFVYVLSVAITHRKDTQGIVIPHLYEVLPTYFHNAIVMNEAKKIKTHGDQYENDFPLTFKWNDHMVIRWNDTIWGQWFEDSPISYYTHDYAINTLYYNVHVTYPTWLGGDVYPLAKDRRGEWFWFMHKQIITRYYMERLSNGLGEIPVLSLRDFKQGYNPGKIYSNGMPFPERSDHFMLQKQTGDTFEMLWSYEYRILEAIDKGFFINNVGERVSLARPEDIDALGNLIQANVDSQNSRYFKDLISLWKKVLGSNVSNMKSYSNMDLPLTLPSTLENYQTAFQDPAFYQIWKYFLKIVTYWQRQLPLYKRDELVLPSVEIQKVETDKLLTYFENVYLNISNALPMTDFESKSLVHSVGVLVQRPQLNHKVFKVRVNVKSEVAKTVVVRFFLAPKYDSKGMEIPLHLNTENFLQLDAFIHELPQGETVIQRDSTQFYHSTKGWNSAHDVFTKAQEALKGQGQFMLGESRTFEAVPNRLILPKGRVGGMPFVFMVYISEYHAPKTAFGTGFDPAVDLGLGSGARHHIDDPLGFPVNRPLYKWQIKDAKNIWFEDVLIYHKHTPEVEVPHNA